MKKEIWKFDVPLDDFELQMPKGAKILTFQVQRGVPRMWVFIDWDLAETVREIRKFTVQGTGHGFNLDKGNYIGTIQQQDGSFVWHLFEVTE